MAAAQTTLAPEPSAVGALKPHLVAGEKRLRRLVATYQISGNASATGETTTEFESLAEGFLAASSATILNADRGHAESQTVSACGLVPLARQRSTLMSSPAPVVVPLAGVLIGLGLKTSAGFSQASRLVGFESETASLCRPTPGSSLAFKTRVEHKFKVAGREMSGVRVESIHCKVSDASKPASELAPSLAGTYLPVSCEAVTQAGAKTSSRYAYLQGAAQYLLLEEGDGGATFAYRPMSAQYAE